MSLEVCILASGSGGNCTVVRTPNGTMLIDAGLGPRSVSSRMNGTGVTLCNVSAVCLTHLDSDHFSPAWADTIISRGIRVFCHESRVAELLKICPDIDERIVGFEQAFEPVAGLSVHPIELAHDADGSHGFLISGFDCRIGYATDLGRVTSKLIEQFVDLDVLAIESNYDPQMQFESGRPAFLKQRIVGGKGHLSNEQAFNAVRQILDCCERQRGRLPAHIVLLHRSRQCNCPKLLRKLFCQDARIAPRLTLAEQFERSPWLRSSPSRALIGEQLLLAWA
jgi:phosphoribosyl 1,2-cyclic phosphodiesterase